MHELFFKKLSEKGPLTTVEEEHIPPINVTGLRDVDASEQQSPSLQPFKSLKLATGER